ncbi:MAG: metallophosphoesterase [Pseudomonadota bacterium]
MILRFVVSFIAIQLVAVAGGLFAFKQHKNKRTLLYTGLSVLYLNSAYLFLFSPIVDSHQAKTIIDCLIMYPFFAYMLACIVLSPFFILSGAIVLLIKFFSRMKQQKNDPEQSSAFDDGRRGFMKMFTAALVVPMAGSSLYGSYIGKNRLEVEKSDLVFHDLPEALEGFTIAQISDIHVGPFMDKETLKGIIQQVNGLSPDLVVITGDIINWGSSYIDEAAQSLSGLKARRGVFAVLGNHDFYCDTDAFCRALENAGVQMLRNTRAIIGGKGSDSQLHLIGIDDPGGSWYANNHFPCLEKALRGIPQKSFKVLLSHRPNVFEHAARENIQLTLAGHTHGGQVILPDSNGHGWSLARIAHEHDYGLYRQNGSCLYVNRGLGVVGPPVRINCPREITRIMLRRS